MPASAQIEKDSPVDCHRQKKAPTFRSRLLVFALPIFTASHPATIVGVHVLNFCVRDGNRWTHMTINTNSLVEEVFPFLYFAVLADFCYQPHYSFRIIADFHPLVNPFLKGW